MLSIKESATARNTNICGNSRDRLAVTMSIDFLIELYKDLPKMGAGSPETIRRVYSILELPNNPIILDVGCGTGMTSIELAKISKGKVVAIDLIQNYLNILRERAEKQGVSPSNLLRSLMHQALEREDVKIANAESNIQSIHTILFEILKYLQQIAFESDDDRTWQAFTSSFIPEYLDEMIGQTLRDSDIKGEQYQAHYWQSIDEAWGTSFSEQRPLLAVHLKRDVMNEIRDQKKHASMKRI